MAYLEAGFGLMGLPEEHGGIPCDMVTLGMLTEEFVHNAGFTAPYLNATLALRDMVDFGSDEQIKMCFDAYQEMGKPISSLGFTTETKLGRLWLDCRGMQIAGGIDEIMVYIAGRQIAKEYAR